MRSAWSALLCLSACTSAPAPLHPISDEPAPSGPTLGSQACLAGGLSWEVHDNAAALDAYVSRLVDLGATQVRFPADWVAVEPVKGTYTTAFLEPIIAALEAHEIKPIVLLGYGHPAYNGRADGDRFYPATDPADFGRYAGVVARAFGTRVAAYELWNEPNAGYRFFKPREDAVKFAAQVSAAEKAIHEACPGCVALFGGVFWHPEVIQGGVDFIRDTFEAAPSLRTALDGLAVHPYTFYPPIAAPDDDTDPEVPMLRMLEQSLAAPQTPAPLPLWLTELGWPVQPKLDEETQAEFLTKAFALAGRAGVVATCWYELENGPKHGTFPPEHDFGLLHYDARGPANATPKPAYGAFQLFGRSLTSVAYARDRGEELGLSAKGDAALLFRDAEARTAATIVWSTNAPPGRTVRIPRHAGTSATLLDHAGRALEPAITEREVVVPVDERPRILIERVP